MVDFHPDRTYLRSPLLPLHPVMADTGAAATVRLEETTPQSQIGLRGEGTDAVFAEAIRAATGLDLPAAGRFAPGGGRQILWLGPSEFLLTADNDPPPDLLAALEKALEKARDGQLAAVVDLSHNRVRLTLSGPNARDVLEKGCLLDLHPRGFTPGQCVGTVLAGCQIFLMQTDDTPTYQLLVRNSFSRHLTHWLLDAMVEFG